MEDSQPGQVQQASWTRRITAAIGVLLGAFKDPKVPLVGWFILWAALLNSAQLVLEIAPGHGLPDFLSSGSRDLILKDWRLAGGGLHWLAALLLLAGALFFVPAYTALLLEASRRVFRFDTPIPVVVERWIEKLTFVAIVLLPVADEVENLLGLSAVFGGPEFGMLRHASTAKWLLAGVAIAGLLTLFLAWFFGTGSETRAERSTKRLAIEDRARMRAAFMEIVWRSRYVLSGLVLYGGLVLVMDQSRDVMIGLARAVAGAEVVEAWLMLVVAMLATVIGVWVLAHTCYVWPRILCRLHSHRFAAQLQAVQAANAARGAETLLPTVEGFACWWARCLGALPVLMVNFLCGLAARDAAGSGDFKAAWWLLAFGMMTLIGVGLFLRGRGGAPGPADTTAAGFFECIPEDAPMLTEYARANYAFWLTPFAPPALMLAALAMAIALRAFNLWVPQGAPVTLAVISLLLAFWLGVIGMLAGLALRRSVPYLMFGVIVVGMLGFLGLNDPHTVWRHGGGAGTDAGAALHLAALSIMVLALLGAAWFYSRQAGKGKATRSLVAVLVLLVAACIGVVLAVSDRMLERALTAAVDKTAPHRITLDRALVAWLEKACTSHVDCGEGEVRDGELTVYFVSAEGGGIRAAYWTALVLATMTEKDAGFSARTFSLSGVSGGAVGMAVYRACLAANIAGGAKVGTCVRQLGARDFLTQLLGGWLFEDTLATMVPTAWCSTPGCGIFGRGAWFECGLESAVPGLAGPLEAAAQPGPAHQPYLLLNSTWVETGARAIGSEILVTPHDFPTAHDVTAITGQRMALSTAAHNAARFPYVNAIGSLHAPPENCPSTSTRVGRFATGLAACSHLADGGYFDNSGGHSTGDAVRALRRVLAAPGAIGSMSEKQSDWLRQRLRPRIVNIHNESGSATALAAALPQPPEDPKCKRNQSPEEPRCKGRFTLFVDLLGPPITVLNAAGTGAHGRLAESLEKATLAALPGRPGLVGQVIAINLLGDAGVRLPLGWYLSPVAQKAMEKAAQDLVIPR